LRPAFPIGYGLYRQVLALGHECTVVAPLLIPRKAGDRVKTNRRDAVQLARLLRAGELTAVWVPDEGHEAMRDLVRAREAAVDDLRRKRQAISSLLLKHGRVFSGKTTWGAVHVRWLQEQSFTHPAQQIVLQEMVLAERHARERLARIEVAIADLLPAWSLAPVVDALQALRGIRLVTAATIMVEAGDLGRFASARQFMGLSRACAGRALDRQCRAPARDHQDRQQPPPTGPGRERLELPPPAPHRQAEALRTREASDGG
jgi:transposase